MGVLAGPLGVCHAVEVEVLLASWASSGADDQVVAAGSFARFDAVSGVGLVIRICPVPQVEQVGLHLGKEPADETKHKTTFEFGGHAISA